MGLWLGRIGGDRAGNRSPFDHPDRKKIAKRLATFEKFVSIDFAERGSYATSSAGV